MTPGTFDTVFPAFKRGEPVARLAWSGWYIRRGRNPSFVGFYRPDGACEQTDDNLLMAQIMAEDWIVIGDNDAQTQQAG